MAGVLAKLAKPAANAVAKRTGIPPATANRAVELLVPVVVAALTKRAAKKGGAGAGSGICWAVRSGSAPRAGRVDLPRIGLARRWRHFDHRMIRTPRDGPGQTHTANAVVTPRSASSSVTAVSSSVAWTVVMPSSAAGGRFTA